MSVTWLKMGPISLFRASQQPAMFGGSPHKDQLHPWAYSQNLPTPFSSLFSLQLLLVKACQTAAGWRPWGQRQRDRENRFGATTASGNSLCTSFLSGFFSPSLSCLPTVTKAVGIVLPNSGFLVEVRGARPTVTMPPAAGLILDPPFCFPTSFLSTVGTE